MKKLIIFGIVLLLFTLLTGCSTKQIDLLEEEQQKLKLTIEDMQTKISDLNREIDFQDSSIALLEFELNRENAHVIELETQLNFACEIATELEKELAIAIETIRNLEEELMQTEEDIIITGIDYESVYEEYYSSVEYTPDEIFNLCPVVEPGTTIHWEIDYIIMFPEFSDMVGSEAAKFTYGEIYRTEAYNCIAESVYFKVYNTEFDDERFLIRFLVPVDYYFINGDTYMLNLIYAENIDAYFLSQNDDSIFPVKADGSISGSFFSLEYPNTIDAFIDEVFK